MATGTVKWFSSEKGFGFIKPDVGGGDVFVLPQDASAAGLAKSSEGQKVSFTPVDNGSGKVAAKKIRVTPSKADAEAQ